MLGVFALGRILNMNIATSQALGDMTWGVGSALHEEGVIDLRPASLALRQAFGLGA